MIPEFGVDRSVLLLYFAAFVLAHLLLFAYLSVRADRHRQAESSGSGAEPSPTAGERPPRADPPSELPAIDHEAAITCPHCGADNEPDFRYCRNCIGELRGGASFDTQNTTQQQQRPF